MSCVQTTISLWQNYQNSNLSGGQQITLGLPLTNIHRRERELTAGDFVPEALLQHALQGPRGRDDTEACVY